MDSSNLYLFFIASVMLNLTPGNDMLFVASRSISQGYKGGMLAALGVFMGCFIHIAAAILGLSVIISNSMFLFNLIKFAGAAYLIYLGLKSLFSKSIAGRNLQATAAISNRQLLKQGMVTNALNPKVAIFFLSFLPQFIDPLSATYNLQLFFLGLWFSVQGTFILIIVAFLVGKSAGFFKRNYRAWRIQEKITGLILLGLGIKLALTNRK